MKAMSVPEAKHHFGQLINDARADAVVVEKHDRPVIVVIAVEEYKRLTGRTISPTNKTNKDEQ